MTTEQTTEQRYYPMGLSRLNAIRRGYRPEGYTAREVTFGGTPREEQEDKLQQYGTWLYNHPQEIPDAAKVPWVRGIQLGLPPEEYFKAVSEIQAKWNAIRAPEDTSIENLGLGPLNRPPALTKVEKYLLGVSDEPPVASLWSVPMGQGIPAAPRSGAAKDWFNQRYPSIGRAQPSGRTPGWMGLFTGDRRYAPKIKTVGF